MALVATLVANPSNPVLTPVIAEQASDAVNASGLYWLADGVACDIALRDGTDVEAARANILAVIGSASIDLVIQDAETRRKRLLIADMDSTMIGQECIDELAAEVGLKERVAAITARAMNGEIAFEPALRERGVLHAALFGSVARGENHAGSDVDIMVEIDPDARITVFDYVELKEYISNLFDETVDVVNRDGLKSYVAPAATADAVYAF